MEQYGTRPGHSIELDNLTKQIDSGKLAITICMDLSKVLILYCIYWV